MQFKNHPTYSLDWGQATVEAYDNKKKEITLIFNFSLRNNNEVENALQFVIGRLYWGLFHFPQECMIRVIFDIRDQNIIISRSKDMKQKLALKLECLEINNIEIEFIR